LVQQQTNYHIQTTLLNDLTKGKLRTEDISTILYSNNNILCELHYMIFKMYIYLQFIR